MGWGQAPWYFSQLGLVIGRWISSLISYLRAFVARWSLAMSGPLSVPFAIASLYVQNGTAKTVLLLTAAICALFSSYWIWKIEREARISAETKLKDALEPRPLQIVFDPQNPNDKFWSREQMRDEKGAPTPGSYWEYRAAIKNVSGKTARNVKVTVEAIGAIPLRQELSSFDINKSTKIDLHPNDETLAIIRRWPIPARQAGMAWGADVYGPIKMTASAEDVLPTVTLFSV